MVSKSTSGREAAPRLADDDDDDNEIRYSKSLRRSRRYRCSREGSIAAPCYGEQTNEGPKEGTSAVKKSKAPRNYIFSAFSSFHPIFGFEFF